jgi:hypothetical protein
LAAAAAIVGASLDAAMAPAEPFSAAVQDAAPGAASGPDSVADAELAATTAAPWVPARPVPGGEAWETALRLPGRVVTIPISVLGFATKHTLMFVEDVNVIPKVAYYLAVLPRTGLVVAPASLGDRTGFGVAVGLTPPGIRRFLTARWDGSTLNYNKTSVTARGGPARLDYAYEWRPQERFYGLGLTSSQDDTTTFASQTQQVRLGLGHRLGEPSGAWRLDLAGWAGPREVITRRGREDDMPSFEERFPSLGGTLNHRFEHLAYGARLGLDSRKGVPRWSRGERLAVEVERFGKPTEALALRTGNVPFQFTRWVWEAEGGLSFYRDPRTFRLRVRVVDNQPDASGTMLPSDLATLGGSHGLEGFDPGRFHDVDAVVGRLTYLFPLAIRFELDLHAEAGSVVGDVWNDARLSDMKTSYGVALRPRLDSAVLGAIGVDWSDETVRFRFSVGGVE